MNIMPHEFKDWTTTFGELKAGDTFLDLDTRDDCEDFDKTYQIWVKRNFNDAFCIWCTEETKGAFDIEPDRKVLNLTGASKEQREWWKLREHAPELEKKA